MEGLEVAKELARLDAIVDRTADEWTDGQRFPTLGVWVEHVVTNRLTVEELRLITAHFLVREVSGLYEGSEFVFDPVTGAWVQ